MVIFEYFYRYYVRVVLINLKFTVDQPFVLKLSETGLTNKTLFLVPYFQSKISLSLFVEYVRIIRINYQIRSVNWDFRN
jgi:hypothetical protein